MHSSGRLGGRANGNLKSANLPRFSHATNVRQALPLGRTEPEIVRRALQLVAEGGGSAAKCARSRGILAEFRALHSKFANCATMTCVRSGS